MTQAETIKMLDSIMPDIISTRDPEGTMLKCASKHNLSPAQLEHLGQVYNTTKTIVGLEKQANRGNSFKLLNVPEMVSKYASYDPSKKPTGKSKDVHEKVDKIINDQDGWGLVAKSASLNELPNLNMVVYNELSNELDDNDYSDDTLLDYHEKSAASRLYDSVNEDLRIAHENYDQALFDAAEDIMVKMADIAIKLTPDEGRWDEVKYAAVKRYGDKIQPALNTIEGYFNDIGHITEQGSFNKFASFGVLEDKYGVMDSIKDIYELGEFLKEAANGPSFPPFNGSDNGSVKKKVKEKSTEVVKGINNLFKTHERGKVMSAPANVALSTIKFFNPTAELRSLNDKEVRDYLKDIDDAKLNASAETTIASLLMKDPVVSSADPDEVERLYKAICKVAPSLSESPELMAATLKEALQFGSIPLPTLTALADFQYKYNNTKLGR